MIPKEILWNKAYSTLMRKDWFELLYPLLGDPKMIEIYRFLEKRASMGAITITPTQQNVFAPFDIFAPEDTKLIILGDSPHMFRHTCNNGLAYSYLRNEHHPLLTYGLISCIKRNEKQNILAAQYYQKYAHLDELDLEMGRVIAEREDMQMADAEAIKDINREYWDLSESRETELAEIDMEWFNESAPYKYPMDIIANQGALLLYASPTIEFASHASAFPHADAWFWFTNNLMHHLSEELKEVVFFAFEDRPKNILNSMVSEDKHLILTPNDLCSYSLTEKVNNYIIATKGVKKIIDFKKLIENE